MTESDCQICGNPIQVVDGVWVHTDWDGSQDIETLDLDASHGAVPEDVEEE